MVTSSHLETLTNRYVLVQERTRTLISDLRGLVQLLESEIEREEEHTGIGPANFNYPIATRTLRARRDNLMATISRLEESS